MRSLFGSPDPTPFHDKAWRRADMAHWDARWRTLGQAARKFLLDALKLGSPHNPDRPLHRMSLVDGSSFEQLQRQGFVQTHLSGFVVREQAVEFIQRVRSLRRWGLLDETQPSQFDRYIGQVFATFDLNGVLVQIIERKTGLNRYRIGDPFELFVLRHFWPEWVADYLDEPQATELIEAVEKAGVVPVAELPALLPEQHPASVRETFDRLVNHLALFEDIEPTTLDIVTGLLPAVRRDQLKQRLRKQTALHPVQPVAFGPEGGTIVPDLRAVLLEVSASRPRLKQDHSLFAKEQERFLAALDPLPAWMPEDAETRLANAIRWAHRLELVRAVKGPDKARVLALSKAGQAWLANGRTAQYEQLFADLRGGHSRMYSYDYADEAFLGSAVAVYPNGNADHYRPNLPKEQARLRAAIDGLLSQLPTGTFYVLDQFLPWAGDLSRNPLLLGGPTSAVQVVIAERIVPPLEDYLDAACQTVFRNLVLDRLGPLGCVQLGCDDHGQLLFARLARLDAYFGREVQAEPEPSALTRVIVQPDFSVVVIGIDPTPMAELMPFCDRVQGSATQGALTFRISRDSVFRGIAGGLKPEEILTRLQKHASTAIPQNVLTEVRGWSSLTRKVSVGQTILIRCPDADTATRVLSALGKQGERVGENAVALEGNLTPALRQKLQAQGLIVEGAAQERTPRKRRRSGR